MLHPWQTELITAETVFPFVCPRTMLNLFMIWGSTFDEICCQLERRESSLFFFFSDCTFWFTTEYYTAASQAASVVGWLTRIGAVKYPGCTPPQQGSLQGTMTDALSNATIGGVTIQISSGFSSSTDVGGFYARSLAPGTYTATASKFGYESASATVTIVNGATTVQDFSLTPLPVMTADSSAIVSESFTPANGALDPAETVTVDFTLKNIGLGDTSNLVATLQPTGGVTSPDGPAKYGVIPGNSGTGTQPYHIHR